ncbi:MAG: endonuclease/exonuclease/phosphatase family protein, partial [Alistipes sp.]|nr:endonuclease/exonuclease/phosphatase family protein [Alistipes sp.]
MKKILFTGLFVALFAAGIAQKPYKVVFYNFENLFDTINDPDVHDEEFTPEGAKKWNSVKYNKKIGNLERVLFDIAADDRDYPIVVGFSEVENRTVLEDVIARPKLAPANYRIVHFDSPDARGVDVGFYYRPDVFKLEGSEPVPF